MYGERIKDWPRLAVLAAAIAPACLLVLPIVYLVYVGLSLEMLFVPMIVLGLFLPLLAPFAGGERRWLLPGLAALIGLALLAGAFFTSRFDAQHPKPTLLLYGIDVTHGQAAWISIDPPDAWTSQFLIDPAERPASAFFPYSDGELYMSPAPQADLPAPALEVLSDEVQDGIRRVRLLARSPRGAGGLHIYTITGLQVFAIQVGGIPAPDMPAMSYWGLPAEGIEVEFQVAPGEPFSVLAVDHSFGLPSGPQFDDTPRPPEQMAFPTYYSDSVMVSKLYEFGP